MLFNSLSFAIFLPLVFGIYWLIAPRERDASGKVEQLNSGNVRGGTFPPFHLSTFPLLLQNLASYVFYGWWDWKFLLLITFTSLWACAFERGAVVLTNDRHLLSPTTAASCGLW